MLDTSYITRLSGAYCSEVTRAAGKSEYAVEWAREMIWNYNVCMYEYIKK
jgi:hypothetical protein